MNAAPKLAAVADETRALQIFSGNAPAPNDPDANTEFHVEIIDRMMGYARDAGWAGARFHHYYREAGTVCIGIEPGDGWPGIDELRARQSEIRYRPDFDHAPPKVERDGQKGMF